MKSAEVYVNVTNRLVAMLETGAADPEAWRAPWRAIALGHKSAVGRSYKGVNTLLLADSAARNAYDTPVWGTYKQWAALGAQVQRGQKGTTVVLWKSFQKKAAPGEDKPRAGMFATTFSVFNAAQVDDPSSAPALQHVERVRNPETRDAVADRWIEDTGAVITYGGDRAYFTPSADKIALPRFEDFDSATAFYSTAAHELTHWSGHSSRLDRDLANRFGSEAYAAEELIAELGAAFAMARLGLEGGPRADHAHYLASWAQLLRGDSRAIFTAASSAQRACDFLFNDTVTADSSSDTRELVTA